MGSWVMGVVLKKKKSGGAYINSNKEELPRESKSTFL